MAEPFVDEAADLAVLMAKTEAAAKRREDSWTRGVRIIVAEAVLAAGYATPAQVEQAKQEAWDQGVGAAHRSPLTLFAIKQVNPYLADTTLDRQRAALAESPRTGTKGAKP